MSDNSTAKGGLFGFMSNLFSSQESEEHNQDVVQEERDQETNNEEEVKKMYCDKCGIEMEPGAAECRNCGAPTISINPEPMAADAINAFSFQDVAQDVAVEAAPDCAQAPECEVSLEVEAEPACEAAVAPCEEKEQFNYAEKTEKKAKLGQEIEELGARVQPCLDEIAKLSTDANASEYTDSLNSIEVALADARVVELALQEKIAEFESIIINPCCEEGFVCADKYCGTCGEYLGGIGWLCTCHILNKEANAYCRGCGAAA